MKLSLLVTFFALACACAEDDPPAVVDDDEDPVTPASPCGGARPNPMLRSATIGTNAITFQYDDARRLEAIRVA